MNNLIITANLIFFNSASKYFNFPINNSIRVSFWKLDSSYSSFGEIYFNVGNVELWQIHKVEIHIGNKDVFPNICQLEEVLLGVFPNVIGYAQVISTNIAELPAGV